MLVGLVLGLGLGLGRIRVCMIEELFNSGRACAW